MKKNLLDEDFCKARKFKYQNLAFLFLSYISILLFPLIYMVYWKDKFSSFELSILLKFIKFMEKI